MRIEDPAAVFKAGGLNPRQCRTLLLRWNDQIMSRKDCNEWKRSQRAIKSNQSRLVKAITAATKKRVIVAPLVSGGSNPGVIREGAGYSFPITDEEKVTQNSPGAGPVPLKWFEKAPPSISHNLRKTRHLFKKCPHNGAYTVGELFRYG
jgi:hypothetical protein